MKKLFTIMCVTLLSVGVFAQAETEAGTFLLSGATGFDFASQGVTGMDPSDAWDDDNSLKSSNMEIKLMGAYFVADGLAIGLMFSNKSESTTQEYSNSGYSSLDKSTESTMVIGPSVRYYFGESGVWLQTAYGFGSTSTSNKLESTGNPNVTVDDSSPMSILQFGAGYAISLSDNISLNPSLGYAMSSVTIEDGYLNSSGNLEDLKINMSGMTFNLGIALHLGR